jgi:sugar (pentulose or hexulose) kinase
MCIRDSIDPARPTGLDYYPLTTTGERFPISDPNLPPRLTPRPADDALFLQGMLEGMARIEREAYRLLQSFGAPWPTRVLSVGGGARNEAWASLRAATLGVSVVRAVHEEAAYGSALLALKGVS